LTGRSPERLVERTHPVRWPEVHEARRVRRDIERFPRDDACGLMLAVSIARRTTEDGDDDVGAKRPDHADCIRQQAVLWPVRERFVRALRVAVVVSAREELPCTIQASRREQLTAAYQSQPFLQLGTDQVLAALTTRQ